MAASTAASMADATDPAHEQSDRFWKLAAPYAMAAEFYESASSMSRAADLVVVGRVGSIEKGREWVADPGLLDDPHGVERAMARFATVWVEVEAVLGDPSFLPDDRRVPVEVFLQSPDVLNQLRLTLPVERAIFALRNKGPDDSVEFFRLVNDAQGLIREFGDKAHLQADVGPGLGEAEGMSFAAVIELMREARAAD